MKRGIRFLLAIVFMAILAVTFSLPTVAFGDGPTVTTITWNGGGDIGGTVVSGDDNTTTFGVNAAGASGSFTVTDSNNNPYTYGVDTVNANIVSSVTNGCTWFQTDRTDSYSPMYGSSGQTVYAFVGSSGTGSMATGSATNYANMTNATYGKDKTAGGFNFEADAMGGVYQVQQYIGSANSSASFAATGSGTTAINSMTTGASGDNYADLGWGGGCYTNANMTATGVGSFMVSASGSNRITTPIADASGATVAGGWTGDGDGTAGSVSFQTVMNFITGGSVGNFSVKVQ